MTRAYRDQHAGPMPPRSRRKAARFPGTTSGRWPTARRSGAALEAGDCSRRSAHTSRLGSCAGRPGFRAKSAASSSRSGRRSPRAFTPLDAIWESRRARPQRSSTGPRCFPPWTPRALRPDRRGARTPRVAARRRQSSLAARQRTRHPVARRPGRGVADRERWLDVVGEVRALDRKTPDPGPRPAGGSRRPARTQAPGRGARRVRRGLAADPRRVPPAWACFSRSSRTSA